MARQDLSYAVLVNDAELRLAIQHVNAFNAELAASTVTGKKLDETFRSVGRRTAQVGSFFSRNVTLPLILGGAAAAKFAGEYQTSVAKIHGLTNTSAADTKKISDAILSVGDHIISNQKELADAAFRLQSVGFGTKQTIAALVPIAKAAAAGLGDTAVVADAVASALDAYGIAGVNAGRNTLTAARATAVLIGTVTKGKIAPDELARSLGRVIPIANAMHVSFDQVGASIASMTRQGLNANLATTGLRAFFQTFLKAQPITEKALASIHTSTAAVRGALANPNIGVFPTSIALRRQLDAQGNHPVNVDQKTLTAAAAGSADALKTVADAAASANPQIAKVFPNIRALTAFLILTGPRRAQNATIFSQLKEDAIDSQRTIKRAYDAIANTDIGRFRLALTQLRGDAIKVGPEFLKIGSGILQFLQGIFGFFQGLGPLKGIFKDIAIGAVLFGPIVSIVGRATQAASLGVLMWGRWQTSATKAAYAAQNINIAEDELLIATRKATVQFEAGFNNMTAAANRTAGAVAGVAAATTAAAGTVRGGVLAASGGAAILAKASRGATVPGGGSATTAATTAAVLAGRDVGRVVPDVQGRIDALGARRAAQVARAEQTVVASTTAVTVAQEKLNLATGIGATGAVKTAAAELQQAKANLGTAEAALAQSRALQQVIFDDERLIVLTKELQVAQAQQIRFASAGAAISAEQQAVRVAGLQEEIALRQRVIAGQQLAAGQSARLGAIVPVGGFSQVDQRALQLQATAAGVAAATPARIMAGKFATAVEGMKSTASLGFNFIALTFATELVSKVIFNSQKTKRAVTGDLFDIRKAGVGASAGLLAAGIGIASLSRSAGGLSKIAPALAESGIGGFLLKNKIGLAATAMLGLQASGVKTETIFNAAMFGMLARTVALRAGIFEVGAGFGPWGIAIAAAATVILSQSGLIEKALTEVDLSLTKITHHLPGGKGIKQSAERALFFGLTVPEIKKGFDFIDGRSKKTVDKARQNAQNVSDQLFKQLENGLSRNGAIGDIVKAAERQRDLGNEYAAEQLLASARTKQQFEDVKRAVDYLKQHGKAGVAALLDPIASQVKAAKKDLDALFGNIDTSIANAFEAHTATVLDGFDRQTQSILDTFDEATQKLQDNLKVLVKVPKLHETFTIKVNGGKTPAERELDALNKIEEKRNFQRQIFDARQGLAEAFQVGDPNAIREQQRALQDAETARKKFILGNRAQTERAAADAQGKTASQALDDQRKRDRQAIEDSRSALRRNIEATRTIQEQNLKAALSTQKTLFDRGKESLAKYKTNLLGIMNRFNVSIGQAGADGGKAYADQMTTYFDKLTRDVTLDLNKITTKANQTTAALVKAAKKVDRAGGILGIAEPGIKGVPVLLVPVTGATPGTAAPPNKPTPGKPGTSAFPPTSPTATPAQAAAEEAARKKFEQHQAAIREHQKNKEGLPTRPAILSLLHDDARRSHGRLDAREGKQFDSLVPKTGHPSEREYKSFLAALGTAARSYARRDHDDTFLNLVQLLRGNLVSEGFVRAATGTVVPGSGTGDTVPAMLTPGELVFNRKQQRGLAAMLGIPGANPATLFSWVASHGQRFAAGGTSGGGSSTTLPIVPGFRDVAVQLKRLVDLLAHNALTQQNLPQDPRTSELILGGSFNKKGKFIHDSNKKLKALRKALDPVEIEPLVQKDPALAGLSANRKRALEFKLARLQAHSVRSGLITPSLAGATLGGTRKIGATQQISSGAFSNSRPITIIVNGAKSPLATAREVRRELEAIDRRNGNA